MAAFFAQYLCQGYKQFTNVNVFPFVFLGVLKMSSGTATWGGEDLHAASPFSNFYNDLEAENIAGRHPRETQRGPVLSQWDVFPRR